MTGNIREKMKSGCTIESAYRQFKEQSRGQIEALLESSSFIGREYPEYKSQIVSKAEMFMEGRMVLCGTMGQPYFVGNPPRWTENPLNDNEFVWQLNRMDHWVTLVHAYYLTGREQYAKKVLSELEDWIDTCPPLEIVLDYRKAKERFSSVHPWRSLEVGIRSHSSWNICLEALAEREEFTGELFEKVITSLYEHGNILYQVCPIIWPNANHNHYLTECIGLLAAGAMTPFFKDSDKWIKHAVMEVERCAAVQVTEGGGQVEGCPTYHNECLNWMNRSLTVASKYGILFSDAYKEQVCSMFRHSMYVARPDGNNVPWGDSDALPQVYESAIRTYLASGDQTPLKLCAKAFGREELFREAVKLVWDMRKPEQLLALLREKNFGSDAVALPCVNYNRALKQVMIRKAWTCDTASIFFACRTPVHNDHAHIDPNGFDYCNQGIPVLVDAGRYNYQEGPNRKLFKGGTYHNTVLIDRRDAFEYQGTWAYGPQQIGDILKVGKSGEWDYICGSHVNYFPAVHTRMLAFCDDILFIADRVDNMRHGSRAELYYNLNAPTVCSSLEKRTIQTEIGGRLVRMTYSSNLSCTLENGRASTQIDMADETTVVCLESRDASRLFLTAVMMGDKGPGEAKKISVEVWEDTIDYAVMKIYMGDKVISVKWNYRENMLELSGGEAKGNGKVNE